MARLTHAFHVKSNALSLAATDPRRLVPDTYAADLLGVTVYKLRRWRRAREGPKYRRLDSRVLYQISDLLAYIESLPSAGGKVGSNTKNRLIEGDLMESH